jgi:hypothetical protein
MALFGRKPENDTPVKAAISGGWTTNTGAGQIGNYYSYLQGDLRARLMSIPTVSRARDLMASVISTLPLVMYKEMWNGEEMEEVPEAPRSWLRRLDKGLPNSTLFAWLFDDLFFTQRAFLYVTERTSDGFPTSFTRLPSAMVTTQDQSGQIYFAPSKQILFNGLPIDYRDVVQFISPIQGLNTTSPSAVMTALKLEQARNRNASSSQPAVVLRQKSGEPLSGTEMADMAAAFDAHRRNDATCMVNEHTEVIINDATPDKMLLIDAANFQALEMARLANVPPYLVGVSTGAYSYQSSEQARQDLYIFGVKPYADCIAQTLSGDNVLPRGTFVKFDVESYLGESFSGDLPDLEDADEMDIPTDARRNGA